MGTAAALGIALVISKVLSSKVTDQQVESSGHEAIWTEVLLEFIDYLTRERDTLLLIWT
jgi:hypothetical protein